MTGFVSVTMEDRFFESIFLFWTWLSWHWRSILGILRVFTILGRVPIGDCLNIEIWFILQIPLFFDRLHGGHRRMINMAYRIVWRQFQFSWDSQPSPLSVHWSVNHWIWPIMDSPGLPVRTIMRHQWSLVITVIVQYVGGIISIQINCYIVQRVSSFNLLSLRLRMLINIRINKFHENMTR